MLAPSRHSCGRFAFLDQIWVMSTAVGLPRVLGAAGDRVDPAHPAGATPPPGPLTVGPIGPSAGGSRRAPRSGTPCRARLASWSPTGSPATRPSTVETGPDRTRTAGRPG